MRRHHQRRADDAIRTPSGPKLAARSAARVPAVQAGGSSTHGLSQQAGTASSAAWQRHRGRRAPALWHSPAARCTL
eukprot:scaffold912_cov422-Prasinococcus_capsulatus_cf.AAC.15